MKLAIGIIVFNPDEDVKSRINQYSKVTNSIFIYDNTEMYHPISEYLSENYNFYFNNKKNLGLSKAINFFYELCRKNDIDILLTMDQDSDFSNESIKKMLIKIESDKDDEYLIYCPNYRKNYFDKEKNRIPASTKINLAVERDVFFSMTSGSFYKINQLDFVFPLNDLFIGYVDYEVCFKVLSAGKKIRMIGDIVFDQTVGQNISNNFYNRFFKVLNHTPERYYYMFRNNFFLQEEFHDKKLLCTILRRDILRLIFNILIGEKEKIKKLKYSYEGFRDRKHVK